jgi:hypothetical protein
VRRHRLDLFSLVTGVAFVAVAVLYLLESAGVVRIDGQLVIPLVLIALGVGGLAAALYRMAGDRGRARRASEPAPEGSDVGTEYAPYDPTGFDRPFR